jgi:hypothetical protein
MAEVAATSSVAHAMPRIPLADIGLVERFN